MDRETCPRSTRDFLALSVCLKLRPPRASPFEQSLLEDETRHTGDSIEFRKSSQMNGRKADVSTIETPDLERRGWLLPFQVFPGESGILLPKTGRLSRASSLAACDVYIFALHSSRLPSLLPPFTPHPPSFSHFVRKTRPFEIKEIPSLTLSVPPSLVLACEHCTRLSFDIVIIIVSLDNRLAFS